MRCDECGAPMWRAGEIVPPGVYARVDDGSYDLVKQEESRPLPASFDGHIAWYSPAGHACGSGKCAPIPSNTCIVEACPGAR